jgi:excisionase family DNA binding protein
MEDHTMGDAARDTQRILTVPEVARILGRTELSTRRAIERGVIPARKLGTRVVILVDELDEFLRALPKRS